MASRLSVMPRETQYGHQTIQLIHDANNRRNSEIHAYPSSSTINVNMNVDPNPHNHPIITSNNGGQNTGTAGNGTRRNSRQSIGYRSQSIFDNKSVNNPNIEMNETDETETQTQHTINNQSQMRIGGGDPSIEQKSKCCCSKSIFFLMIAIFGVVLFIGVIAWIIQNSQSENYRTAGNCIQDFRYNAYCKNNGPQLMQGVD